MKKRIIFIKRGSQLTTFYRNSVSTAPIDNSRDIALILQSPKRPSTSLLTANIVTAYKFN